MKEFRFIIGADRNLTKDPEMPWHLGEALTTIKITLVNNHSDSHQVRLQNFKHYNGHALDPLTNDKEWLSVGNGERPKKFEIVDHGIYDKGQARFTFDVLVDGLKVIDREIVVDEPPIKKATKSQSSVAKVSAGDKAAAKAPASSRAKKPGKAKTSAKQAAKKAGRR